MRCNENAKKYLKKKLIFLHKIHISHFLILLKKMHQPYYAAFHIT